MSAFCKNTLGRVWPFILVFSTLSGACGPNDMPDAPLSKRNRDSDAVGASPSPTPTDPGNGNGGDGGNGGNGDPGNGNGGGAGGNGGGGGETPTPEEQAQLQLLQQVMPTCGVADFATYKTAKLTDQILRSAPWERSGTGGFLGLQEYKYVLAGDYTYDATFERVVATTAIGVKSPASGLGKSKGDEEAAARNGALTGFLFAPEQRHLLADPAWKNIYCTVLPAQKVSYTSGGRRIVVEFNPPLPLGLSAKADAARYPLELGVGKVWDQITATVVESNDKQLAVGTKIVGNARVDAISTTASLPGPSGQVVNFTSDAAYRLTYRFEGSGGNAALGLPDAMSFYVDNQNRRLKAAVQTTAGSDSFTISQLAD